VSEFSAGLPVAVVEIEGALGRLWEDSSSSKSRASLLNLVIYCEDLGLAEANTAQVQAQIQAGSTGSKINIILLAMVALNTVVVAAMALMIYKGRQIDAQQPGIDAVVKGEQQAQMNDKLNESQKVIYSLKEFVINLAGSRSRRVVKAKVEFELPNETARREIERRDPQIRDQIILLISSRTYEEIASAEGKKKLKEDLKSTINTTLPDEQKILNVYFTDFIYN